MANRFPLVIDTTDGNKIKELPDGDNLNLLHSSIVNVENVDVVGYIDASVIKIGGVPIQPRTFSGKYDDLTDKPVIPSDISNLTDFTNLLFSKDYNDLSNLPTIPSSLQDLGVAQGEEGQILAIGPGGSLIWQDPADFSGIETITFAGNIGTIQGDVIRITPSSDGWIDLGTTRLMGDMYPEFASGADLGTQERPWNAVYSDQFISTSGAEIGGNIVFSDAINSITGNTIAILPSPSNTVDLGETRLLANIYPIDVSGGSVGLVNRPFGSMFADQFVGSFNGNLTGDILGSVFADDSTVIVDSVEGVIRADIDFGARTGFIRGNTIAILPEVGGTIDLGDVQALADIIPELDEGSNLGSSTNKFNEGFFRNINIDFINGVDPGILTGVGNFTGSFFADDSTLIIDGIEGLVVGDIINDLTKSEIAVFGNNNEGNLGYAVHVVGDIGINGGSLWLNGNNITDGNLVGATGDFRGSIFADDSTQVFDAISGKFTAPVVTGTATFENDVTINGNLNVLGTETTINTETLAVSNNTIIVNDGEVGAGVTAGTAGIVVDRGTANNVNFVWDEVNDYFTLIDEASNYLTLKAGTVTANLTGNVTGNVTGNLTGNVTGNVTGDLTGDVTGNVSGNVTGDLTGNVTGNLTGNTNGSHTGPVIGNVTGNLTGNVIGDVVGSVFADDSTLIIDAVNNSIVANNINIDNGSYSVKVDDNGAYLQWSGQDGVIVTDTGVTIGGTSGVDILGALGAAIRIGQGTAGNVLIGHGTNNLALTVAQVSINGEAFTNTDIANFKTAYGWGDHSTQNYLSANANIQFISSTTPSISNGDSTVVLTLAGGGAGELKVETGLTRLISNLNVTGLTQLEGGVIGDLTGSVFADDSTLLVDAVAGKFNLSVNEIGDLGDVDVITNPPTFGQVLKWDGAKWSPGDDVSAGGTGLDADTLDGFEGIHYLQWPNFVGTPITLAGYGITDAATKAQGLLADSAIQPSDNISLLTNDANYIDLTDLSVSVAPAGSANLAYNNITGVFTYTPPDLSGYATTTQIANSSNWDTAFSWGDHSVAGYALSANVPISLLDLGITDGTSGQALVTDGAGNFSFISIIANELNNLADVTITNPTTGDRLYYNGTQWINTAINETLDSVTNNGAITGNAITVGGLTIGGAFTLVTSSGSNGQVLTSNGDGTTSWTTVSGTGNTSLDALTDVDTSTVAPTNGQALIWNSVDSEWQPGTVDGLSSRATVNAVTGSIANNTTANVNITGYKSYALLKIATDQAAWVRIYTDATSRTNDASRLESQDPAPGAGVIAEVITTGAETVKLSPGIIGWNDDGTPSTTVYVAITNKSGSTQAITATLTMLKLEA